MIDFVCDPKKMSHMKLPSEENRPLIIKKSVKTPQEINILEVESFYSEPIPIEFKIFTVMPDSLLIFRMHADLTYTQQKVLEYLHKVTFGYMQQSADGVLKHVAHLPFSTINIAYGDFTKVKILRYRSRFFATTEREIARNIKTAQQVVNKAIQGLEEMNVIQKFTKAKQKTNYGINYHTLEAVFGGHAAVYNASQAIEAAKRDKLIEVRKGKIIKILFSIEAFYAVLDRKIVRSWSEIQDRERLYLERLFPHNDYV